MSAREDMHRLFESGATSYRLDEYLDAYAHELAEKIRAVNPQPDGWTEATFDYAADLIDPEVE